MLILPLCSPLSACLGGCHIASSGIGGHLDVAELAELFTCLRLPCSYPFPTRLRWPSLRHWTTACTVFLVAYGPLCGCAAVMDAFWTPFCRSTSERRGFSSHLALIWLCSNFFVFALFLVSSHLSPTAIS